jgi:hypothetical protein
MRIAFCKFVGMGNGGVEKYLQTMASIYRKSGHEVDFYYTNSAPLLHTHWVHPDNNQDRINLMTSEGIGLIPVNVEKRLYNDWIGTDFFEKFNESKYDFLVTGGNGESEFPYNKLEKIKIVHTIHGVHSFNQNNIHKSVLLCNWQAERWINNGGDKSKIEIIPSVVYVPDSYTKTFRQKNNIPKDAFVYGFHQRNDRSISSIDSLKAFSKIENKNNVYFSILGGSEVHRNFVRDSGIGNVIFCDYTSNVNDIHDFIDGIDVYAHCRLDGEVCSASIIEAMYHKKPIISSPGINMGHMEQISDCGKMAFSIDEYYNEMIDLQNEKHYISMSNKVAEKYEAKYHYKLVEKQLISLIN